MAVHLESDGEAFGINGVNVAALVNREPQIQTMEDAGYLDKEPVTLEVLKGNKTCRYTVNLNGVDCQADMQGTAPLMHQQITLDGARRKIMRITNQLDRWLIFTIKLNIIDQPATQ